MCLTEYGLERALADQRRDGFKEGYEGFVKDGALTVSEFEAATCFKESLRRFFFHFFGRGAFARTIVKTEGRVASLSGEATR